MRLAARGAEPFDHERVSELRQQASSELVGQRGGDLLLRSDFSPQRTRKTAGDEQLPAGSHLLAVVELEDVVVGYLEAALLPLEKGGALCRIGSIYVEPEARGVGAGEALMAHVTAWAGDFGAEGMDVLALPGNREVKNFFESAGFVARLIVMHHRFTSR
ncbi:MAG: GNAT family N-acetyltransferase [Acidimicrobiales bacterium]